MPNHVSLCQGHEFLIGSLIKISKPGILNWFLIEGLETINKLCVLYILYKNQTQVSLPPQGKNHDHAKKKKKNTHKKTGKFIFLLLPNRIVN